MFIRGNISDSEYRRVDESFYRGIVVKNNDPLKLNRVKVYIPELTNQPYDEWFEKYDIFNLKSPGINSNPKTESEKKTNGDWEDTELFDEICNLIPWAEPCYPLMGESNNFRYSSDGISTISDGNYTEGFRTNDKTPPTYVGDPGGSFSPAFIHEIYEKCMSDAFNEPHDNFSSKCNPYAYAYRPSKHVNKSKGVFGIPEVGSKVWVFHYTGDLQFPVYFGVTQDYRSLTLINNIDNENKISSTYPSNFEN